MSTTITIREQPSEFVIELGGEWSIGDEVPDFPVHDIESGSSTSLTSCRLIDSGISRWDSMLMLFVLQANRYCQERSLELNIDALPSATKKLLHIATTVQRFEPAESDSKKNFFLIRTAEDTLKTAREFLEFLGKFLKSTAKMLRGDSDTRMLDIMYFVHQVGPRGLGIVTLISVLIGMILAYLGSVQLRQLGAQIYVADLVTIGMTREMGPLMTGVILSGRTGAAYAAQLGTMQVNDEIDAIKTMAMSSMEFLVVPRMLALVFIMPLLVIYSDILGMVGGALVATSMDVNWNQYITQTQGAIDLVDLFCGLVKSVFFAALIGIAGCQAGLKCGHNSTAVGHATTTAVVRAIVYLIMCDAAFNVLYDKMGI